MEALPFLLVVGGGGGVGMGLGLIVNPKKVGSRIKDK